MKPIPVTIEIPMDLIADVIVPIVVGAILHEDRKSETVRQRAPLDALLKAVEQTAEAVTHYETQQFTRAERQACARVISAAKGLRKALRAQNIQEKMHAK